MKQKIYLQNTLGKEKQEFVPINSEEIRMYSCGPTVYNIAHIGNLRAYVFADILKRTLSYNDYKVKHIINVTDIGHLTSDADDGEDKMVKALNREGKEKTLENMREVANFYFEKFKEDLEKLNIIFPDKFPFASDHIKEDVEMINTLLEKGFAYKTSDGIYFDTSKDIHYGKLGGISQNEEGARIETNTEKKNYRDFALWKFADKEGLGFEASFGTGFPGWHIECSAMSLKYLDIPFDIHTGGIDHIPVHHNNEITQTECATGKKMANFWMHNAHVTIGEEKMAKSGANFLSLDFLAENNISALAYRYWLLTSRYSTRIDYSLSAIEASQNAYNKLISFLAEIKDEGDINEEYKNKFIEIINNDLDTPKAIALIWELVKDNKIDNGDKKATILDFDKVLGLKLSEHNYDVEIPEEVIMLQIERDKARDAKDWQKSDELRNKIRKLGFDVKDTEDGQVLTKI